MATRIVIPYIHTTANNHMNHKIRTNYLVPDNEPWNLSKIKINWNTLSTVFLLLCMWIYVCCYCCSTASDPESVYWKQLESILFPIDHSGNSVLGTGTSKLSLPRTGNTEQTRKLAVPYILFQERCSGNRKGAPDLFIKISPPG